MQDGVAFHQMAAEVQCASDLLFCLMPSPWCSLICAPGTNRSHPMISGSGKEETLDFVAIAFDVLHLAVCVFCRRH
jgi:hypothetical protein